MLICSCPADDCYECAWYECPGQEQESWHCISFGAEPACNVKVLSARLAIHSYKSVCYESVCTHKAHSNLENIILTRDTYPL